MEMSEQKERILIQLFERESKTQQLVALVDVCLNSLNEPEFLLWRSGKRDLLIADVADSHWIKTCTGGYITEVVFHADGTLDEYRLFDRFKTEGKWCLENGILDIEILKGDNRYCFSVVGNADINIHSAVEHKNHELHSYLKLSQIK